MSFSDSSGGNGGRGSKWILVLFGVLIVVVPVLVLAYLGV